MKNTTIKKTSLTLKAPPKRNPLVALALLRIAGPHRKNQKALRRAEQVQIQRQIQQKNTHPHNERREYDD